MSQMSVEFSFDDEKLQRNGESKADLYCTLKKYFQEEGLACVADREDMLIFSGVGKKSDYGILWALILAVADCDWITDYLTHFMWVENDREEDILPQLSKMKRKKVTPMRGLREQYA